MKKELKNLSYQVRKIGVNINQVVAKINAGYRNPRIKNLSIRIWECPKCHAVHDRDTNAGINILKKALQMQSA